MARMTDFQRMLEMQQMANDSNDSQGDFQSNPFAFAAQAPVAPAMLAPVATQAPTAQPIMMSGPVGRDGSVSQQAGPSSAQIQAGIIDVPKPPAILAEEQRLGGKQLEPIYAQGQIQRGRGAEQTLDYGPPIGYRYDNGQSQYVNFDAGGQYQGTADRQNLGTLIKDLAPLALAYLGANYLVPMLSGAGGGGGGLLGEAAVLGGAGDAAANLTPAAIESLLGTSGYGTNASALEFAKQLGLNLATVGAGANLPFPGVTPTPIPTPPPPIPKLTPAAIESLLGTSGYGTNASALEFAKQYGLDLATVGSGANLPFDGVTPSMPPVPEPSKLPSWVNPTNALLAASAVSSIAKANETAPTAPTFTMAPYVPPSGKPFANLGMSPIATPYTPTRIAGQYDPTMTPGGVSPYELIMQQMQAPKNLYADFEAGTNIGGYDPQRFVVPPAAAAAALPNNMGGMIDKSRMVGPNPMGPDNGFASIQDGEFVMNRKATQKYGIELMNAINSGKISKGKLSGLLQA